MTTYGYDVLGRVTEQTLPGNRVTIKTYNGLETTVTGPLNKSITKTIDVLGNLVTSKDHDGNTVTYHYFSSGLLREVIAPGNAYNIFMNYDLLGNQTLLDDPNLGTVNYTYNVYGELLTQTDERSTTSMEYDLLGRLVKRTATEGETNWIYDQGFKGRLSSVSGPGGISQSFQYDDYGRLSLESEIIQGQTYVTRHTYDDFGREDQLIYPSNFAVKHVYDSHGYLAKIQRASDGVTLWEAKVADAWGQLKQMQLGNGLITQKEYWENTGYIKNITTGNVQNLDFIWDDRGNLLQRKKGLLTEDFTYDNLDRMHTSSVNGFPTVTISYDALGNIKSKTDVAAGSFSYGLNAGPNALTGIAGSNGVISDITQEIDYSSFHKVTSIREGTEHEVQFIYGPEHTRKVMKRLVSGVVAETKTYVGLYEKEEAGGTVKEIHYLNGGDGLFAIHTIENETTATTAYVLKDHLGSIHCLVNQSGAVTEELSFDAWGRRRNPLNWEPLTQAGNHTTMLGFTGHEHIDIAALVNMNGRVYDPLTGRFLSPDPFMQAPGYSQGLNRYSYCLNNPLSLTDPSGYTWLSDNWRSLLAGAVGVSVAILTAGTGTAGSIALGQAILSGAAGGFAGGFTGSLLNGGNVGDAVKAGVIGGVIGGISAGAANKVGSFFGDVGKFNFQKELARSLAHGSVGGLTSMAQGGKFKHGFFAGSFASMAGSGMQASGWGVFQTQVGGGIAAAVVGGTASELGGGKFANGAVTGAYTMLFNHMAHGSGNQDNPGRADWNDSREVYYKTKEWMKFIAEGNSPAGTDYWNVMDIYENIEYKSGWKKFLNGAMKGNTSRSLDYPKAGLRIYVTETNLVKNYRANYIVDITNNKSLMTITLFGTDSHHQGVIVAQFTNRNYYNKWMDFIFGKK